MRVLRLLCVFNVFDSKRVIENRLVLVDEQLFITDTFLMHYKSRFENILDLCYAMSF